MEDVQPPGALDEQKKRETRESWALVSISLCSWHTVWLASPCCVEPSSLWETIAKCPHPISCFPMGFGHSAKKKNACRYNFTNQLIRWESLLKSILIEVRRARTFSIFCFVFWILCVPPTTATKLPVSLQRNQKLEITPYCILTSFSWFGPPVPSPAMLTQLHVTRGKKNKGHPQVHN